MDNSTVRIVFYVDSVGGVEKVLEDGTAPCSECGTEKPRVLTFDEIEALGYEAGRVIGGYTHGRWYRGLIEGLLVGGGSYIVTRVAKLRRRDVQAALDAAD